MTEQREAVPTVGFIDEYCQDYRSLFADIRSFEAFKLARIYNTYFKTPSGILTHFEALDY